MGPGQEGMLGQIQPKFRFKVLGRIAIPCTPSKRFTSINNRGRLNRKQAARTLSR